MDEWEELAFYVAVGIGLYLGWQYLVVPQIANASISPVDNSGSSTIPMTQTNVSTDVDILARTIWGEARGEGTAGMEAVANVVMNRYHAGNFPGSGSIAGVCRAYKQFSCWLPTDTNYQPMINVTSNDPQFSEALQISQEAVNGQLPDNTGGAVYYHATSISTPSSWGNRTQTAQIGNQVFFI